jgi:hypothetical protein
MSQNRIINRHIPDDHVESVTFYLSSADTSTLAGKRYKIAIPLTNAVLDEQFPALAETPAYFSALLPLQFGNATTAAPAGVDITAQQIVVTGSDANDPKQAVVAKVVAVVEFGSGVGASFTNIPLVVKGFFRNALAPVHFDIPAITGDVSPKVTVTDASGNSVPVNITALAATA